MIKHQLLGFLLRVLASSLGIWLCVFWLGHVLGASSSCPAGARCVVASSLSPLLSSTGWIYFVVAGLVFSLLNSVVKPFVKIFALPLAILTMGVSTIIINAAMVALTIRVLPGVEMSFWGTVLTSLIMSAINSVINYFFE